MQTLICIFNVTFFFPYLHIRFIYLFICQDWLDIDFGIAEGVDFIAVSFVKSAEVLKHLKSYIKARARDRYEQLLLHSGSI